MPDFNTICPIPVVLEHGAEGRRDCEVEGRRLTVERWLERRNEDGHLLEVHPFTLEELQAFASQPHATLWDWILENWGCKWPAQDVVLDDDGETAMLQFDTP